MRPSSPSHSLRSEEAGVDEKQYAEDNTHVERTQATLIGLTEDDIAFLRNFSEERRKKVVRKV